MSVQSPAFACVHPLYALKAMGKPYANSRAPGMVQPYYCGACGREFDALVLNSESVDYADAKEARRSA